MDIPEFKVLPKHIGIIMDGNGRWAKQRGLKRSEGHKQGAKVFKKIGELAASLGIEYMTFYAFSTENWSRPEDEVNAIMELFKKYLDEVIERIDENQEKGYKLHFIGNKSVLTPELRELMQTVEEITSDANKTIINVAINYGGRVELVKAVKEIAESVKSGILSTEEITEQTISDHLYTSGQPDPDLIIRPSGEYRLSNFLTYQSAYSEFLFSDILWPDFTEENFIEALSEYEKRNRRFGGV